ncbi:hypothetical protein EDB81DRAFT_664786 [Dactylonectria macrodidyma]|uniref:Clr5 domain-containing protein n=1 Tax=Dactylonectria macrodidyma TaxID=307937 RepID=A0A9P9DRE7_9HYPO|nr:hypothetical protein EDB81DRAFT_664786 [Dactylonectria macrodidyma]
MNSSTANPPVFGELNLPRPIQSPYVAQQAYESHGNHLALDDSASQTQALDRQFTTDGSHMSHSFNSSQALRIHAPYNAESFGDTEIIPAIPMGPPTKPRKRKAPTLRAEAWEPYKARILELHITQKLPLKEVKEKIEEEFDFTAQIRQYRTRITQWGKDKNIKPVEMTAIVRKRQQRKLVEVDKGELNFTVRGSTVESQKIDRWMNRHRVPENLLYAPSPAACKSTCDGYCLHTTADMLKPPHPLCAVELFPNAVPRPPVPHTQHKF